MALPSSINVSNCIAINKFNKNLFLSRINDCMLTYWMIADCYKIQAYASIFISIKITFYCNFYYSSNIVKWVFLKFQIYDWKSLKG